MVNNPQLTKIKQLLEDKFIPQNQQLVEEVGVDDNGDAFVMQRKVGSSRSVDYFICRFDPNNNSKFFPYFKQIEGLHKICDYIIFAENSDSIFVFLVELKKGAGSPQHQLDISEPFVDFIINRAAAIDITLDKTIQKRKIGIKDRVSSKKSTQFYKDLKFDNNRYVLCQGERQLYIDALIDAPIDA